MIAYSGILCELDEVRQNIEDADWLKVRLTESRVEKSPILTVKAYIAWVSGENLRSTVRELSVLIDRLSNKQFHSLYSSRGGRHTPYHATSRELLSPTFNEADLENVGMRAAALLVGLVNDQDQDLLFSQVLQSYCGEDDDILDARVNSAWHFSTRHPESWPSTLGAIAQSYGSGVLVERVFSAPGRSILPVFEARKIVQDAGSYPLTVINVAESALAEHIGSRVIPVGSIAVRDQWFEEC